MAPFVVMKQIAIASILIGLAFHCRASVIVYDPINHATNVGDQIVNFAKWTATQISTAQTELNTLKTYENTVVQLARMGDPAALRSLPGVSTIAELAGTGRQLMYDYQTWQTFFNPQHFQGDMNTILNTYKQPGWNGFTALNGIAIPPNQGSYQFSTASWNIANDAQTQLAALEKQRQTLEQQRDSALQSLQVATDQSSVQKYTAVVTGLNGALAEVSAREGALAQQLQVKQQQINAGQQVYQASQAERQRAADLQSLDADVMALPASGVHQSINWGQ
jgi:hypothetical protein